MPAGDAADGNEIFRRVLVAVSVLAGAIHVAFLALFQATGVGVLANINVASVLCYVLAFFIVRRGHALAGILLMSGEVVAHAVLASVLIGWGSGFHHYIILVVPVIVLSSLYGWPLKLALSLGFAALYAGLSALLRSAEPPYRLDALVLDGLHLFNVAGMLVILIALSAYYFILVSQAQRTLRLLATTDPLTQLSNRRHLLGAGQAEVRRVQRYGRPLSVILCDVDHFKLINDRHGHDAGDAVLRAVSRTLQRGLRNMDLAARWGGEEFLLLLPETPLDGARQLAERLRADIAAQRIAVAAGGTVSLTLTFGVAAIGPDEALEQAISRADAALLAGKREGRDRVVTG